MSDEINVTMRVTGAQLAVVMRSAGNQLQRRRAKGPFVLFMTVIFVVTILGMVITEQLLHFEVKPSHFAALFIGIFGMLGMDLVNGRLLLHDTATRAMDADEVRGDVHAKFNAEGMHIESGAGRSFTNWAAISEIMTVPDATALRFGAVFQPIPDAALPMSADEFRAQLQAWKDAA